MTEMVSKCVCILFIKYLSGNRSRSRTSLRDMRPKGRERGKTSAQSAEGSRPVTQAKVELELDRGSMI